MSGLPKASSKLVTILRRLRNEKDDGTRMQLLDLGRQALLNWFSMGARNLINGSVPMTKPTEKSVRRNLNYLTTLSDRHADPEVRRSIILRRGGAGFLGGVIIRSLLRWPGREPRRDMYYTVKKGRHALRNLPSRKKRSTKKRSTKRKSPAKRKGKGKAPAKRKGKGKAPAKRKGKGKGPAKRKSPVVSPAASPGLSPDGPSTSSFGIVDRSTGDLTAPSNRKLPTLAATPVATSTPISDAARTALEFLHRNHGIPVNHLLNPTPIRYAPGRKNVKYTARKQLGSKWKAV